MPVSSFITSLKSDLLLLPHCVCVYLCEWMQHCLLWFMIWYKNKLCVCAFIFIFLIFLFPFSLSPPPPPYHWAMLCFRDLQIIASYVNTIFAMYTSYLFIVISKYFQWFCFSCMFITINSGSIIFYLFVFCLFCLNINQVCKKIILFFSLHFLFGSLARTGCYNVRHV